MSLVEGSTPHADARLEPQASRRSLLKWTSAAAVTAVVLGVELNLSAAYAQRGAAMAGAGVDLGSGDFAVLNYAYALEQLEAAYYTQVLERPYRGMNAYEQGVLTDLRDHEIAHREFFRGALGSNAIPDLQVDFSRVNFGNRQSVLTTARTFEDLGVSAYNGAGQLLQNPQFLAAAGTIVSVEARHAAILRDILSPLSTAFAGNDVVDGAGLDVARVPSQVLPMAAPFILTPVSASQLP